MFYMHNYCYLVLQGVERIWKMKDVGKHIWCISASIWNMLRNKCGTFLKTYVYTINGLLFVLLFRTHILSPRLPKHFCFSTQLPPLVPNNAHWLSTSHGQTHHVVASLRLEFAIKGCGAPASKAPHKFLPIEVRGRWGRGYITTKRLCVLGRFVVLVGVERKWKMLRNSCDTFLQTYFVYD